MEIVFSSEARKDLKFWKESGNKQVQRKIEELIMDIHLHPFAGMGQPEAAQIQSIRILEVKDKPGAQNSLSSQRGFSRNHFTEGSLLGLPSLVRAD